MKLPIGILIFWVSRSEEGQAIISALWYYKEMYVPSTVEEKENSVNDLKQKRCTVINIHGKYNQIADILSQGDKFINAGTHEIAKYYDLLANIEDMPINIPYKLDDVYNLKGSSLMVDTLIDIKENMEDIKRFFRESKTVNVSIIESWSLANEILGHLTDDD